MRPVPANAFFSNDHDLHKMHLNIFFSLEILSWERYNQYPSVFLLHGLWTRVRKLHPTLVCLNIICYWDDETSVFLCGQSYLLQDRWERTVAGVLARFLFFYWDWYTASFISYFASRWCFKRDFIFIHCIFIDNAVKHKSKEGSTTGLRPWSEKHKVKQENTSLVH